MNLLEFDEHLKPAFEQIFGQTLIARDLESGFDFAIRYEFDIMTLDGDKVNVKGVFEGGYIDDKYRCLPIMRQYKILKKKYYK